MNCSTPDPRGDSSLTRIWTWLRAALPWLCLGALLLAGLAALPLSAGPATELALSPASASLFVGGSRVITVGVASVAGLYGYQLQVDYNPAAVSAQALFVNGLVDVAGSAFGPPAWSAACDAGTCRFAVTQLNPALPVAGSGPLAVITFTGVAPGVVPLTFSADLLSDRDGFPIAHARSGGSLTVYGTATVSGIIRLMGRYTPVSPGLITLTPAGGVFPPTVVAFSATDGSYRAVVPVEIAGSTYSLVAWHSLYLINQYGDPGLATGLAVTNGGAYTMSTFLWGGDANNDATVDIFDLSCVGYGYDLPPLVCGFTGSTDLNEDGVVDIFDLVMVGSDYDLSAPQPW